MNKKKMFVYALVSWSILLIYITNTSPKTLPIVLILAPLLLLFSSLFLTILAFSSNFLDRHENRGANRILHAALLAALPVAVLLLQSVNQLTVKDTSLIFAFAVIIIVYMKRFRFINTKQ